MSKQSRTFFGKLFENESRGNPLRLPNHKLVNGSKQSRIFGKIFENDIGWILYLKIKIALKGQNISAQGIALCYKNSKIHRPEGAKYFDCVICYNTQLAEVKCVIKCVIGIQNAFGTNL